MEISIIIPTYNRANLISRTLESVRMQSHRPIHLIIVDNNSTDNTMPLLREYKDENESDNFKVSILEEPRKGASFARNMGLDIATSEWVMFFDSDDTMEPYHVAQIVDTINKTENSKDLILVRQDCNLPNGKKVIPPLRSGSLLRNHIYHSILSTLRYAVKRKFIINAGKWNEELRCWDDWELGIRLLLNKPQIESIIENIPVHVFVHENSMTGESYSSRAEEMEQTIDAARQAVIETSNINQEEKDKIELLLEFKRVILAGLYTLEGDKRGKEFYKQILFRVKKKPHCSWAFPLIYRYISFGGRGSAKIIDLLV